jgi:hypothetical protein
MVPFLILSEDLYQILMLDLMYNNTYCRMLTSNINELAIVLLYVATAVNLHLLWIDAGSFRATKEVMMTPETSCKVLSQDFDVMLCLHRCFWLLFDSIVKQLLIIVLSAIFVLCAGSRLSGLFGARMYEMTG